MSELVLQAEGLTKSYKTGAEGLSILKGVSLQIQPKESICIVGASGAGKSTLLQILGTLDRPDAGQLRIRGQDILAMNDEELAHFRNEEMGFVFQFHHLLTEFTALENVALPMRIGGASAESSIRAAEEMLEIVGLAHRSSHFPSELSGGELQRVAIGRALVKKPHLLFADEPTGNLDSQNSGKIQEMFFELKQKLGLTLVVVTHDLNFAKKFSRVLRLKDGRWEY